MKVLFFHIPAVGQYNAVEPVLLELVNRGHTVIHYNEQGFERYQARGSLGFCAYERYGGYHPSSCRSEMSLYELGLLLLETAEAVLDGVDRACLQEDPQVILHSKFVPAAKVVAAKRGVPAVCLTSGFVLRPGLMLDQEQRDRRSRAAIANIRTVHRFMGKAKSFYARHAREPVDPHDVFVNEEALNLVLGLEHVQPGRGDLPDRYQFVGPTVHVPQYAKSYDLIYVSMGAVFAANKEFFDICLAALGGVRRRVVVALGDRLSPDQFPDRPANVEIVKFAPQKALLQQAALFITHGGGNSVYEAIYCATPMIVIPQIAEQRVFARHIASLGLGQTIQPRDLTADLLRHTVCQMLDDESFSRNVQAMKASFPRIPAAVAACDRIESLA